MMLSSSFASLGRYGQMMSAADELMRGFWAHTPYLMMSLLLFAAFWLLAQLFKWFVGRLLGNRLAARRNVLLLLKRIGGAGILLIGFLCALVVAVPGFTPGQLISTLGIGSVAVGFAFKDILQNLLSGILLLVNEPFRIGDNITSNGFTGVVEDVQIRATTLRAEDGSRIVIPNAQLFTAPITVHTGRSPQPSVSQTTDSHSEETL